MTQIGTAYVEVKGDLTQLQADVASALAPAKLGKFGKVAGVAMGGALAAGVGAAIAGKIAYDLGAEFDAAFDKIRINTGKTGKPLEKLKKDFKAVFASVPTDADTAADAISNLNKRLDLSGKPLRALSKNMLELSRMTETDLTGNIQSITRLFGDWSVSTAGQVPTLNKLWRASQKTGVNIKDLSDLMVQFGSPLRNLGFDFDTAAAMFSKFEKEGVNIQTAMPGLRMALKNFASDGKDPQKALEATFKAIDKAGSVAEANTIAFEVFGTRAGPDLAAAVREGRFEFDNIERSMRKGKDTIMRSSKDTRDLGENMQVLGNKLKVVFEPLGTLVFHTVGKISEALAALPVRKWSNDVQRFVKYNEDFKDVLDAVRVALRVLGAVSKVAWGVMKDQFKAAWGYLKSGLLALKGLVKIVSGVFTGDWRKAWSGVKDLFRGSVGIVLNVMRGMTAPMRAVTKLVAKGIASAFEWGWSKVENIFKGGANAVISVVNKIIDAINVIPGVPDIDNIDKIGGSGSSYSPSSQGLPQGRQRGGPIFGGKPSGDSVPALLERGEYVLNREAVKTVGVENLDHLNFRKARRFQKGGPIGLSLGGDAWEAAKGAAGSAIGAAGDVAGAAAGLALKPASWFIGKLPKPNIPAPFTGLGPWMIDQVTEWIKDKVPKIGPASAAGAGVTRSYPGLSGDTDFAIELGRRLSRMSTTLGIPISVTEGFRTFAEQTALWNANPNPMMVARPGTSNHEDGMAADISPQKPSYGGREGHFGLKFPMSWEPWHIEMLRRGGRVGDILKMAIGGGVNINRRFRGALYPSSAWNALPELSFNVAAALAEAAGDWAGTDMPGVTFAQMSKGEGALKPGSMGDDNGDGKPDGYGWLAITRPYGDGYGVKNYEDMLNPVLNAAVAAKMYGAQGIGAWYGDGFVTNQNAHYSGGYDIRKSLGGMSFAEAVGSPGKGGGMSEAEKARREAKARKEAREAQVRKLIQKAGAADSPLAKKGALWQILDLYAQFGEFGSIRGGVLAGGAAPGGRSSEKARLLERAGQIASLPNPNRGAGQLYGLVRWLEDHVDMTGVEKGDEHLSDKLSKVIDRGQGRAGKRRKRIFSRLAGLPRAFRFTNPLDQADRNIALFGEWADIADQKAGNPAGPGGSDYTDDELAGVVGYVRKLFGWQSRKKNLLDTAIPFADGWVNTFRGEVRRASSAGSPDHWKLPGFRQGLSEMVRTLGVLRSGRRSLVGLTGEGGELFQTKQRLAELGVTSTVEKEAAAGVSIGDLTSIIQAAKFGVYDNIPVLHDGGIFRAPAGQSEGYALLRDKERVFTPEQMAGGEFRVIVNGDIVSDHPNPVEAVIGDRRFKVAVEKRISESRRQSDRLARQGVGV